MESTHQPLEIARDRSSMVLLGIATLVPLAGVLLLGWEPFDAVVAFLLESMVLGASGLVRVVTTGESASHRRRGAFVFLLFFLVPTVPVVFWLEHVERVYGGATGPIPLRWIDDDGRIALASFGVAHGWALWADWFRSGRRRVVAGHEEGATVHIRAFGMAFALAVAGLLEANLGGGAVWFTALVCFVRIELDIATTRYAAVRRARSSAPTALE